MLVNVYDCASFVFLSICFTRVKGRQKTHNLFSFPGSKINPTVKGASILKEIHALLSGFQLHMYITAKNCTCVQFSSQYKTALKGNVCSASTTQSDAYASAHVTVFPVSINLIGQFGTFEVRHAFYFTLLYLLCALYTA